MFSSNFSLEGELQSYLNQKQVNPQIQFEYEALPLTDLRVIVLIIMRQEKELFEIIKVRDLNQAEGKKLEILGELHINVERTIQEHVELSRYTRPQQTHPNNQPIKKDEKPIKIIHSENANQAINVNIFLQQLSEDEKSKLVNSFFNNEAILESFNDHVILMNDIPTENAYITPQGTTYDIKDLESHFKSSNKDPLNNTLLSTNALIKNLAFGDFKTYYLQEPKNFDLLKKCFSVLTDPLNKSFFTHPVVSIKNEENIIIGMTINNSEEKNYVNRWMQDVIKITEKLINSKQLQNIQPNIPNQLSIQKNNQPPKETIVPTSENEKVIKLLFAINDFIDTQVKRLESKFMDKEISEKIILFKQIMADILNAITTKKYNSSYASAIINYTAAIAKYHHSNPTLESGKAFFFNPEPPQSWVDYKTLVKQLISDSSLHQYHAALAVSPNINEQRYKAYKIASLSAHYQSVANMKYSK